MLLKEEITKEKGKRCLVMSDEHSIEEYAEILKGLLNTDYVGFITDNQLKMGKSTLEMLVEALRKRSDYGNY